MVMNLLLDTHMLIWFFDGLPVISDKARSLILDATNQVFVSEVSLWEIAIKHAKRPEVLPYTAVMVSQFCEQNDIRRLPLTMEAIEAYEGLDFEAAQRWHRDPFDRMLIAQAKAEHMTLLTHDKLLALYGEPNVTVV